MHYLIDDDFQKIVRQTETLHKCLHGNDVTYMICAEDVDALRVPASILVVMISGIRKRIRRLAVAPDEHPVLVVSKLRRAQPDGTFVVVDDAPCPELLKDLVIPSLLYQRALGKPRVIGNTHIFQGITDRLQNKLLALFFDQAQSLLALHRGKLRSQPLIHILRELRNVRPAVPIFRHGELETDLRVEVMRDRLSKQPHLGSVVINIVLAVDSISLCLQQICKYGSQSGAPPVAHMERPRRIGAHELHLDLVSIGILPKKQLGWCPQYTGQNFRHERFGQLDVEVSGRGALHMACADHTCDSRPQPFCDGKRGHMTISCQFHRKRKGVIQKSRLGQSTLCKRGLLDSEEVP